MTATTTLTAPPSTGRRPATQRPGSAPRHVWKTGAVAGLAASVATVGDRGRRPRRSTCR